jgi:aspartate kinase
MELKSIKFGGTSMGSANAIIECCDIIKNSSKKNNIIVIVSAVSGTTDTLLEIIELARKLKPRLVQSKLNFISNTHKNILFKIVKHTETAQQIWDESFFPLLDKLQVICHGTSLVGDLTDKTVAKICSFGEKLSTLLIVNALNQLNIKNKMIESERVIKTDNNYLKAKVNVKATNIAAKKIIRPLIKHDIIPIITGFIAKDTHGDITLLGRGGSDYTAAILATALHANAIEIWTDVDGIMTADPRIVKNAFSWHVVDMNIISEMAFCGAKVIHPDTIVNAVEKNIPVFVFNTFNRKFKGTKVIKNAPFSKGLVTSPNNTLITIENTRIINDVGFVKEVSSIIASHNISIDVCATSEISFTFSIQSKDYSKKLAKSLEHFGNLKINHDIVKLSFIGDKISDDSDLIANVFHCLAKLQVKINTVSIGAAGNNITVLLDKKIANKCLINLHEKLLDKKLCQQ